MSDPTAVRITFRGIRVAHKMMNESLNFAVSENDGELLRESVVIRLEFLLHEFRNGKYNAKIVQISNERDEVGNGINGGNEIHQRCNDDDFLLPCDSGVNEISIQCYDILSEAKFLSDSFQLLLELLGDDSCIGLIAILIRIFGHFIRLKKIIKFFVHVTHHVSLNMQQEKYVCGSSGTRKKKMQSFIKERINEDKKGACSSERSISNGEHPGSNIE
jgi:hypothetical protein